MSEDKETSRRNDNWEKVDPPEEPNCERDRRHEDHEDY